MAYIRHPLTIPGDTVLLRVEQGTNWSRGRQKVLQQASTDLLACNVSDRKSRKRKHSPPRNYSVLLTVFALLHVERGCCVSYDGVGGHVRLTVYNRLPHHKDTYR
jgi:hypothetical protein